MLTVVMPNYNHARYLPEALEGLLRQTRRADEIIVIDDASTDNSVAVIEPFLSRQQNIRLIRNEANQGVVASTNRGLKMAAGDLILFAAADDVSYPRLIERASALLADYPSACLFSAQTDIMDAGGRSLGPLPAPVPLNEPGYIPPARVAEFLLEDDGWFSGNTTIWRTQMLREVGGFSADLGSFADGFLYRKLALQHGACFSPEVLSAWRRIEGGQAWTDTASVTRLHRVTTLARQKMESDPIFPRGYPARWEGRHLFGAQRFNLIQARRQARKAGLLRWFGALAKEALLTPWLFASLRPRDVGAVINRRMRRAGR